MYMYIKYVINLAAVNLVHGTSESKSSPPLATMLLLLRMTKCCWSSVPCPTNIPGLGHCSKAELVRLSTTVSLLLTIEWFT